MMKPDGGPAFPQPLYDAEGYESNLIRGMTLRDYFAAAAVQGIVACFHEHKGAESVAGRVRKAYEYADAMLAERKK